MNLGPIDFSIKKIKFFVKNKLKILLNIGVVL